MSFSSIEVENLAFYQATIKNIKPVLNGNDATVNLKKVKIKSKVCSETNLKKCETINRSVKVTMHEWASFEQVQIAANLSLKLIQDSLHPKYNEDMIFAAGEGAGRSGSFFFFSHDKRFIIKTMSKSELALMRQIVPDYV